MIFVFGSLYTDKKSAERRAEWKRKVEPESIRSGNSKTVYSTKVEIEVEKLSYYFIPVVQPFPISLYGYYNHSVVLNGCITKFTICFANVGVFICLQNLPD
jgi:hypothetical protein